MAVKGDRIEGFEIAGRDREFVKAAAEIKGSRIAVSAEAVPEPKFIRYAWTNYGPVTLYNRTGIPLTTFRTDQRDDKPLTEYFK